MPYSTISGGVRMGLQGNSAKHPLDKCIKRDDLHLLYVGISPNKPQRIGNPSKQNLRLKIKDHCQGNAESSTLKLTLGCLLSNKLGIELRRVGKGRRMTFHDGEDILSQR